MALNLALKVAMLASHKTQRRIAKLLKMHESELSFIVRGRRPASEAQRKKLADFLQRDEQELFPKDAA